MKNNEETHIKPASLQRRNSEPLEALCIFGACLEWLAWSPQGADLVACWANPGGTRVERWKGGQHYCITIRVKN